MTHGTLQESSASVTNLIVRLAFDPLPSTFDLATASAYSLSGTCDFSLAGDQTVTVSLEGTGGSLRSDIVSCISDRFTVTFDASEITESSFTVQAIYGTETQTSASVPNNIVRLSLTQPTDAFNAGSASAYPFSGLCDSSIASGSSVVIGIQGTVISRSVNCASNSFSGTLDASAVKDINPYPSTLGF